MIYNIRRVTIARTSDDQVQRYGYNTDMFCTDLKAERTRLKSAFQAEHRSPGLYRTAGLKS